MPTELHGRVSFPLHPMFLDYLSGRESEAPLGGHPRRRCLERRWAFSRLRATHRQPWPMERTPQVTPEEGLSLSSRGQRIAMRRLATEDGHPTAVRRRGAVRHDQTLGVR